MYLTELSFVIGEFSYWQIGIGSIPLETEYKNKADITNISKLKDFLNSFSSSPLKWIAMETGSLQTY